MLQSLIKKHLVAWFVIEVLLFYFRDNSTKNIRDKETDSLSQTFPRKELVSFNQ